MHMLKGLDRFGEVFAGGMRMVLGEGGCDLMVVDDVGGGGIIEDGGSRSVDVENSIEGTCSPSFI